MYLHGKYMGTAIGESIHEIVIDVTKYLIYGQAKQQTQTEEINHNKITQKKKTFEISVYNTKPLKTPFPQYIICR